MRRVAVLLPAPLAALTGGYEYDRRMIAGLRRRGWQVDVHELGPGFPHPDTEVRIQAARTLAAIAAGTTVLVDGLAFGALPSEMTVESARLRLVALVHMPLGSAAGLARTTAEALGAGERLALSAATLVVVTGHSTVSAVEQHGIPRHRIVVVEPGTDRVPRFARRSASERVALLAVGSVTEGKGHRLLVRALGMLPDRNWHLTCAGSLVRDQLAVARLREAIRQEGLVSSITLLGDVAGPDLSALYKSADVFVLATLHETYCMAVAQALAHALPVVSTTTGAIPELVGQASTGSCAGLLVPPGDVTALASALRRVLTDANLRRSLAENAWQRGSRLPTWDDAADQLSSALEAASGR